MTDKSDGDNPDYKVGKNKPPVEHRFKSGDRGNPKGRPKGSPNLATALKRAAREKVIVTEGGRRKTITKIEAALKQLLTQAAGGDARAIQLSIELLDRFERRDDAQAPGIDTASRTKADAEILKALKDRIIDDKPKETNDDEEK
jgi:hypothetical protein